MPKKIPRRQLLTEALSKFGDMTCYELADVLGWDVRTVSSSLSTARADRPGELYRIVDYRPVVGRRADDLAVFSCGPGPDEPRRQSNKKARRRAAVKRFMAAHGERVRAQDRLRKAAGRGKPLPVNIWMPLAPKAVRYRMTLAAANCQMQDAA